MDQTYGSNDTGAIRTDQTGLVLGLQDVRNAHHVCRALVSYAKPKKVTESHTVLRDALSDTVRSKKLVNQARRSFKSTITYQTARGTSASMASSIPLAASGGLVRISLAIQQTHFKHVYRNHTGRR